MPDSDVTEYPDGFVVCKYCGKTALTWHQTEYGWRLFDASGKYQHYCNQLDRILPTMIMKLHYMDLKTLLEVNPSQALEYLNTKRKSFLRAIGPNAVSYEYRFIDIQGYEYKINLSRDIAIWTLQDMTLLRLEYGHDAFNTIMEVCNDFRNKKIVHCSNCEKEANFEDVKGNRYNAGVYCNECWERRYRKLAKEENYD